MTRLRSGELCFSGHTTPETLAAYQDIAEAPFDTVVLRSGGGLVDVALTIAEDFLRRDDLTVIVWDYCMPSCANWLFLAADWKG